MHTAKNWLYGIFTLDYVVAEKFITIDDPSAKYDTLLHFVATGSKNSLALLFQTLPSFEPLESHGVVKATSLSLPLRHLARVLEMRALVFPLEIDLSSALALPLCRSAALVSPPLNVKCDRQLREKLY